MMKMMMLNIILLLLSMFTILVLFGKTCIQQKRIEELEYALLKNDERIMYKTTTDKRIVELEEENEQLKEKNEKLQWELGKTREDLDYFANLKVSAMRGSDCEHDRCYVTSMQKKR